MDRSPVPSPTAASAEASLTFKMSLLHLVYPGTAVQAQVAALRQLLEPAADCVG